MGIQAAKHLKHQTPYHPKHLSTQTPKHPKHLKHLSTQAPRHLSTLKHLKHLSTPLAYKHLINAVRCFDRFYRNKNDTIS